MAIGAFIDVEGQITNLNEDYKNQVKYWIYRDRFFGNGTNENPGFIVTSDADCPNGDCEGYNIPFNTRNEYYHTWDLRGSNLQVDVSLRSDVFQANRDPISHVRDRGLISYGDATIQMGTYLAVLASEWALLNANNQPTLDTERKLYLALKAINRLDYYAEDYYGLPSSLNGFFMREDVPFDFLVPPDNQLTSANLPNYINVYGSPNDNTVDRLGENFNLVGKTFHYASECDHGPSRSVPSVIFYQAMSQDQVIGLFLGFRMIDHLVHYNTTYTDPISGDIMNIKNEVHDITNRILNWVQAKNNRIKDPIGDRVCRGFANAAYWKPLVQVAEHITGDNYPNSWVHLGHEIAWNAAIAQASNINAPDVNKNMTFKLQAMLNAYAGKGTWSISLDESDYEIYDLINSVLFNNTSEFGQQYFKGQLTNAPCTGPSYFGYIFDSNFQDCLDNCTTNPWDCDCTLADGCKSNYTAQDVIDGIQDHNQSSGWYTDAVNNGVSRFDGTKHKNQQGEHNGLDYMLWYNLYHLKWGDHLLNFYNNNATAHLHNSYPIFSQACIGCQTNPVSYYSYDTEVEEDFLQLNAGYVDIISPISIHFGGSSPDVFIGNNSNFLAKIDELAVCNDNGVISKTNPFQRDALSEAQKEAILTKEPLLTETGSAKVYPNPTSDFLTVHVDEGNLVKVEIYDPVGNLVLFIEISEDLKEYTINVSDLSDGTYYLKIYNDNQIFNNRFVKAH